MSFLLILAGLIAIIPWTHDHWRHTQFLGLWILTSGMSIPFGKRFGIIPYLALVSTLFVGFQTMYFGYDEYFLNEHHPLAGYSGQAITILLLWVWLSTHKNIISNERIFSVAYLGLINAIWICLRVLFFGQNWGMLNNSAADGTLIACCYPILGWRPQQYPRGALSWWDAFLCTIIPPIAIVLTNQSTPLFCLAIGMAGIAFSSGRKKLVMVLLGISAIALPFLQGNQLLNNRGRFECWRDIWIFMSDFKSRWAFGMGSGTLEWLLPSYQKSPHKISPLFTTGIVSKGFLFAHNEFIQVWFEQGIMGLVAMLWLMWKTIKHSYKKPWLFGSVLSITLACGTQMPFRYLPFQILCFSVLILARREGSSAWKD